ncbi:MAG: GSCFA domain-containing protein, partial [Muribaculaceae bacterium]|nr:GSCFA domain-containing protein [Muribaculaceae bacterium]
LWVSWLTDSGSTTYDRNDTKDRVFHRFLRLHNHLKGARTLIVTFGTAWVYELKERPGYIVSNCHKFPSDTFLRRRLTVKEITEEWNRLIKLLSNECPDLRIIFTVSPVRHLKDGFEGNSRSKAVLQLACEEICMANANAVYFPSFEIMNDDLRDYRFYASDLVHPSDTAVDYIWNKFQETFLTEASRKLLSEGEKITKRLNHRPIIHGNSQLAEYMASLEKSKASEYYNAFISAHPTMLHIDE